MSVHTVAHHAVKDSSHLACGSLVINLTADIWHIHFCRAINYCVRLLVFLYVFVDFSCLYGRFGARMAFAERSPKGKSSQPSIPSWTSRQASYRERPRDADDIPMANIHGMVEEIW